MAMSKIIETRENTLTLHKYEALINLTRSRNARIAGDMREARYYFGIAQFTIYYMLKGLD